METEINVSDLKDMALKRIDLYRNGDWNVILRIPKKKPSGFPEGEFMNELPDGGKVIMIDALEILKWVKKLEMGSLVGYIPGYKSFNDFDV